MAKRGRSFLSPITLAGSRLRTLIRWAAGDRDISGKASVGAFALSTNATLGGGGLKFDEASGELSGTKFSGALRYYGGEQRLIDLTLDSDRLDLREVLGESAAWRSWLPVSATKQEGETSEPDLLAALRDDEVLATLRVGELLLPNIPLASSMRNSALSRTRSMLSASTLPLRGPSPSTATAASSG